MRRLSAEHYSRYGTALRIAAAYPLRIPTLTTEFLGGMGIRISSYELARTVSEQGELGVISGTCIDTVLVRTLQNGTLVIDLYLF